MKKDQAKEMRKPHKKEMAIVRSSAAEYLTFVAAGGGIVEELTALKRNRPFSCAGYIEIMSRGTELPERQVRSIPFFSIQWIRRGLRRERGHLQRASWRWVEPIGDTWRIPRITR